MQLPAVLSALKVRSRWLLPKELPQGRPPAAERRGRRGDPVGAGQARPLRVRAVGAAARSGARRVQGRLRGSRWVYKFKSVHEEFRVQCFVFLLVFC